ncbi:hypothetical protein EVAR_96841_1 [Eumeta japonica]|uniref:Uncharacterized protein n=1 Tax=Eumeta variegata TaxID=151549 RepID=A0A4C1WCP9_EUMVA|nr:hypothetical protein EVAR_96841_1 [Eumeta japonica]
MHSALQVMQLTSRRGAARTQQPHCKQAYLPAPATRAAVCYRRHHRPVIKLRAESGTGLSLDPEDANPLRVTGDATSANHHEVRANKSLSLHQVLVFSLLRPTRMLP